MSVTRHGSTRRSISSRRRWGVAVALIVVLAAGWAAWRWLDRADGRAERLLNQARALRLAGHVEQAEQAAAAALNINPWLGEAALLAADSAVTRGEFETAVAYLEASQAHDPRLRLQTALFAAQLLHERLRRFSDAEEHYRIVLEIDPDHIEANTGLAKLLGLCARRTEAVPHILRLVRQGVATDLLVMVGRESGVIHDLEALKAARRAAPDDPCPLLGLAWQAAWHDRSDEAIELLQTAIRLRPDFAAAHIALGRQFLAAGRFDQLRGWAERLPASADDFAETWFIRGRIAEEQSDVSGAMRCYWEASRRAPESTAINFRLARLLDEAGFHEPAARLGEHVRRTVELGDLQAQFPFSTAYLSQLIRAFEGVGRLWEAYGWCLIAVEEDPSHADTRRLLAELQRKVERLPLRLTVDPANVALTVDLSGYPLPTFRDIPAAPADRPTEAGTLISFREEAQSAGMSFEYFNGTAGPPTRRMFEFTGGGVGVLDFDLDAFADVYFTQGCPWPPGASMGEYTDRLFRNGGGVRFEEVTDQAKIHEAGFGQGVTVGDVDADGFPDLYVANIGANQLWRNNGDGTFSDVTPAAGVAGNEWTTSCVLADLSGDGLPDLYAANYVTGPDVYERVCRNADGSPALCMPFDFDGQTDRLWLNDGNGRFTDATAAALSIKPDGKGLGVAVWDADGSGRLSLLVANDTTPNFFFVNAASDSGTPRLQERGLLSGLALNGEGKPEGSMGIALGDVNDDGRLDVYVTNFLAEQNTLYLNIADGLYEDRTQQFGLREPTWNLLGFGTQALDADLDGELELFVTNGHVDDLRAQGKPYRMPAKLYRRSGAKFVEVPANTLGPYFQQDWLGRPAARLDWNRDGRDDLIVGHLWDASALLTNTTPDAGRFLSLKLVGVQSNRDAIGTTVTARIGERTLVRQLTAGDGYQASNERRVIVGTGNAERIEELIVRWPSGLEQRFTDVPVPQELWLVEGRTPASAPVVGR